MVDPQTLLDEWVSVLQNTPALVAALGGVDATIAAYSDALDAANNLRLAIFNLAPGSLLVVYNGTTKKRVEGADQFSHQFSLVLKSYPGAAGYAALFGLFINSVPTGATLPLLHMQIDANCYPIDQDLPTSSRQTLLLNAEGATMDYFEIRAALTETGAV